MGGSRRNVRFTHRPTSGIYELRRSGRLPGVGNAARHLKDRGSPGLSSERSPVRFDLDILAAFKATGKGCQARINGALREWIMDE